MRKNIVVAALVIWIAAASLASAEEMKGGMAGGMMGEEMMSGGMDKGMMMSMHGMMGKTSMVATSDGGVIVLKGNKLTKYDKNLNLVKEAALKADEMDMGKMKMCPMCQKMMGEKKTEESNSSEKAVSSDKETSEHESHH